MPASTDSGESVRYDETIRGLGHRFRSPWQSVGSSENSAALTFTGSDATAGAGAEAVLERCCAVQCSLWKGRAITMGQSTTTTRHSHTLTPRARISQLAPLLEMGSGTGRREGVIGFVEWTIVVPDPLLTAPPSASASTNYGLSSVNKGCEMKQVRLLWANPRIDLTECSCKRLLSKLHLQPRKDSPKQSQRQNRTQTYTASYQVCAISKILAWRP